MHAMVKPTSRQPPLPARPADAPAPLKQYVKLRVDPKMQEFLENRGARPDRGGSRWNFSAIVREQFELFMTSLNESDPRKAGFPPKFYNVLVELLSEPWSLNGSMIKILDSYVASLPLLDEHLEAAGIDDRKAFFDAIARLSFAERLAIVEEAHVRHAPRAEPGSPDL
jgi:hypothetical protein